MSILIHHRYRPFSHEPGTALLLPKSPWQVRAYPARLEFCHLGQKKEASFTLSPQIEGPVNTFTVMQDLERAWIGLFLQTAQGYFSMRLLVREEVLILFLDRCPDEGLSFLYRGALKHLQRKEELTLPLPFSCFDKGLQEKVGGERMHFGIHKAQDWSLVKRRQSLEEILPIWFQLGKGIPKHPPAQGGTVPLLKRCEVLLYEKNRVEIGNAFLMLFRASFEGILSPRLFDTDYQGLTPDKEPCPPDASPLVLLSESAQLIRALLIQETKGGFSLLPCLPKEIHAGRFIGIQCGSVTIDLEWSKKMIRRVALRPLTDHLLQLTFSPAIRSFRLRMGKKARGQRLFVGGGISLKKGTCYLLDQFAK